MPSNRNVKARPEGRSAPRAADRSGKPGQKGGNPIVAQRRLRTMWRWVVGAAAMLAVLGVLFAVFRHSSRPSSSGGGYQVGQPGVGAAAPAFDLAGSTGGRVSLADFRGKTVLLYFQEGLSCQPCWDQIASLEKNSAQVKAAGVDSVVSITTDPVDLIAQKTHDMGLSTPVLSDPNLAVSKAYHANSYGMMGTSRDGHTFILVGPDGTIRWRADYGGAPRYTMYVAPQKILHDMRAGQSQP
jgi:peroxiredoxin